MSAVKKKNTTDSHKSDKKIDCILWSAVVPTSFLKREKMGAIKLGKGRNRRGKVRQYALPSSGLFQNQVKKSVYFLNKHRNETVLLSMCG
jgi:hypothetical protein